MSPLRGDDKRFATFLDGSLNVSFNLSRRYLPGRKSPRLDLARVGLVASGRAALCSSGCIVLIKRCSTGKVILCLWKGET